MRVFAGVGTTVNKDWPDPDTDLDGIVDPVDDCVKVPETKNGWKDEDGCPDGLAAVSVLVSGPDGPLEGATVTLNGESVGTTDKAGTVRASELMPGSEIELAASHPTMHDATPGTFPLAEGDNDASFLLAWLPGTVRVTVVDPDGNPAYARLAFRGDAEVDEVETEDDGTGQIELAVGDWKVLVISEGFAVASVKFEIAAAQTQAVKVQLRAAKVEVKAEEIEIKEKVFFDVDKATIKDESQELLAEIAATISANPRIVRIEVQGHTDSDGSDSYNLELSQKRVDAVVAVMIAEGVSADRLVAKGYGEAVPIGSNDTAEGKADNRRVQFIILEQDTP